MSLASSLSGRWSLSGSIAEKNSVPTRTKTLVLNGEVAIPEKWFNNEGFLLNLKQPFIKNALADLNLLGDYTEILFIQRTPTATRVPLGASYGTVRIHDYEIHQELEKEFWAKIGAGEMQIYDNNDLKYEHYIKTFDMQIAPLAGIEQSSEWSLCGERRWIKHSLGNQHCPATMVELYSAIESAMDTIYSTMSGVGETVEKMYRMYCEKTNQPEDAVGKWKESIKDKMSYLLPMVHIYTNSALSVNFTRMSQMLVAYDGSRVAEVHWDEVPEVDDVDLYRAVMRARQANKKQRSARDNETYPDWVGFERQVDSYAELARMIHNRLAQLQYIYQRAYDPKSTEPSGGLTDMASE